MCLPLPRLCLLVSSLLVFVIMSATATMAGPSCTCRYGGQSYQVNSCVCITTAAAKPQVACCGMVVNNPSWTFTRDACPSAEMIRQQSLPTKLAASSPIDWAPDVRSQIK